MVTVMYHVTTRKFVANDKWASGFECLPVFAHLHTKLEEKGLMDPRARLCSRWPLDEDAVDEVVPF
jgi:hypothetical protein